MQTRLLVVYCGVCVRYALSLVSLIEEGDDRLVSDAMGCHILQRACLLSRDFGRAQQDQ